MRKGSFLFTIKILRLGFVFLMFKKKTVFCISYNKAINIA